jgi:hypothetical protein
VFGFARDDHQALNMDGSENVTCMNQHCSGKTSLKLKYMSFCSRFAACHVMAALLNPQGVSKRGTARGPARLLLGGKMRIACECDGCDGFATFSNSECQSRSRTSDPKDIEGSVSYQSVAAHFWQVACALLRLLSLRRQPQPRERLTTTR